LTPAEIEAIKAALHAIQGSRAFKDSERMCRFLRFAAEHALRQDPAPLKEYAIGSACSTAARISTRDRTPSYE
jgi:hypothetical protein